MKTQVSAMAEVDTQMLLFREAQRLGVDLAPIAAESLTELADELLRWNQKINLTGQRDLKGVVIDLLLDAMALVPHVSGETLLDIGSGGGFPGLPLAIAMPALRVTSLEGREKRIAFQKQIIRKLDLGQRVEAIEGRASEDRTQDPGGLDGRFFDCVTLRAVAGLEESLALARPYLATGGVVMLPRGTRDRQLAGRLRLRVVDYTLPEPAGHRIICLAE